MRVGCFGGSFDPIHHGHLIAAEVAAEVLGLDQIRFIPAGEQPLKLGSHVASGAHRAAMVALAIEGQPRFFLDRLELERPGPSYTVDTLRALRARDRTTDFFLLLGSDAARDLPRWREVEAIRELARVIVFDRAGSSGEGEGIVEVPAIAISSTEVRDRARTGRSIRYWVPDAVERYIADHRLYQEV
jgi:nicotinate-nucleotide adenylyltransferase